MAPREVKSTYQVVAELIYAEHPDRKEALNNGAQLVIDTLKASLTVELSSQDIESILAIIAAIAADILATSVNGVSEKVNMVFDIHSLAAGAVAGEIDLGDVSAAKDVATLMKEAREQADGHDGGVWYDQTGQYL